MADRTPKVAPWEDIVLRIIAIYKFIKATLALTLGLALLKLVHHDVAQFLHDYITDPLQFDSDVDSENHFLAWSFQHLSWLVQQMANLTPHKIRLLAYANFFYATIFFIEGIGLYLKKHWAEYMVLVVTGSFLPFEGYLLYLHLAWWKLVLLTGNLLIVVYLIHRLLLDCRTEDLPQEESQPSAPASADKQAVTEVR